MVRSSRVAMAAGLFLLGAACGTLCRSQTPLQDQENQTLAPFAGAPPTASQLPVPPPPLYRDLDLLRRDGFAGAQEATVSLKIFDKSGATPPDLQGKDFSLIVNGTPRTARLHVPDSKTTAILPMVLLVFPPNQPVLHSIAVTRATQYFSQLPAELLPWRVGIYDANGKLFPFTDGRSQLLANLGLVEHALSPFVFMWNTSWLRKAEDVIATMQRFEGPKVVLAMNPLAEPAYGLATEQMLAQEGPANLMPVAQHVGAHIYVANVGGPDVLVPGGDASQASAAQVNTPGGVLMGTVPSGNMQVDPRQTAALNYFAYNTSQMMQSAADTLGGFSNSFKDLAAQIHRDLDGNYSMDFDLTPEDRDHGIPAVEVRLARHDLKVSILDVFPVGSAVDNDREIVSKEAMDAMRSATRQPVLSPDFRITQHVDFFPIRSGLEPVLPMSCEVEWTGPGAGPRQLSVVESVEDTTLSTLVLEREIHARWDGRSLSWERDEQLPPGHYAWRVLVHDGNGKIYSSSQENVQIHFPRAGPIAVSSLVLGKTCQPGKPLSSGLQRRVSASSGKERTNLLIDPMRAGDCRLIPEAGDRFAATDTLHTLVRLYPKGKLGKLTAESWTAKFALRSGSGAVEAEKDLSFSLDSSSGYVASIEMPLSGPKITAGPHTLDVEMQGPGIRGEMKESRAVSIAPREAPEGP